MPVSYLSIERFYQTRERWSAELGAAQTGSTGGAFQKAHHE